MIKISHKGDFKNIESFFNRITKKEYLNILDRYGQEGVTALSSATPKDSGYTSSCWDYKVRHNNTTSSIEWTNSNVVNNVSIAIILQYGHGTGTGGYVQGYDYINPAIRPIMDKIANDVWKEVTRL